MSAIVEPEFPAGSPPKAPSEGPHVAALEKAHEEFRAELASNEGYEDQGESDGVQLWRKPDPSDPYAASTVKGEAIVQNATPDQVSAHGEVWGSLAGPCSAPMPALSVIENLLLIGLRSLCSVSSWPVFNCLACANDGITASRAAKSLNVSTGKRSRITCSRRTTF